ncbi:MAG: 23S rRNA (uracil(1939)-C(5))-methyltransferase RlmD [Firmicutes bacterium]|nr:23S rRNA (uracil(1939)-C(5))-methyltransferase RlmD [Bacillota bacterium]
MNILLTSVATLPFLMYNVTRKFDKGMIFIIPVKKNETHKVLISALSSDGSGIAKISGYTLFIPQTLPHDEAEVLILKTNKNYGYAKLKRILSPSPYRINPPCPHFTKCGGCQLMMANYSYQKKAKCGFLKDALSRIGGIDTEVDIIGAENPYHYRNKMVFPFDKNGNWGFYRERSHDVIPLSDCLLGDGLNSKILNAVADYMKNYGVSAYDEQTHKGIIRRVFIRNTSKEFLVVISANTDFLPHSKALISTLCAVSEKISGIVLNVNKNRTNLVLGDKNILLWGKGTLSARLLGLQYEVSPESFFQVNPSGTEKLYSLALDFADIKESDTVLDIYCGIGTITLSAAKKAKKAIGIEIVPKAIENARENATRNGIENAEFYCGKAEDLVPKLIERGISPDIVILDPPRKGSDEATLSAIAKSLPKRIIYISCNPATLARDAKFLESLGYNLKKATAVDMFPHTAHVETVAVFDRSKTK